MAHYTPLLMEHQGNDNEIFPVSVMQSENETHNIHIIIDMQRSDDNVPSSSNHQEHIVSRRIDDDDDATQELQPSSGLDSPNDESHEDSTPRANSEPNSRSPFISRLWILFELCIVVIQIMTLSIALLVSRHEKIGVHLFVWVVGYALGCIAAVPVLCWHYYNISNTIEPNANWFDPNVSSSTHALEDGALNVSSSIEVENQHPMDSASSSIRDNENNSLRFSRKMSGVLDAFFAVWFIYGNVCLLGGYASPVDSPIIYELCLIFVTLSYIGYAMPLILCATICCFLPCIVTAIESQEEQYQTRGATAESIDALPTFTFKLKGNNNDQDFDLEQKETSALASQKHENEALGQDFACCCVCLAEFEDDEEMRELPCSHFFHVECIDTWLKINATCPLCKFEIGLSDGESPPTTNSNQPNS